MATQITTLTAGYISIQAGYGVPNHAASKGSQFTDISTAKLYFNKDGLSNWEENIDISNTGSTIGINTFSSFSSSTIGQGSVIATTSSDNLTFSGVNLSILVDNTNQILTLSAATSSNGTTFTGGTVNGFTNFTNGLSATTISATTFYGNGSNLTGISTQDTYLTGGTYSNGTATFTNNTGGTFTVSGFKTSEVFVTGGTYSNSTGITTFTNNTGGTFTVSGYFKPTDDVYTTGMTFNASNYNLSITRNDGTSFTQNLAVLASDMTITGGTYSSSTGVATFTNNTGGTFTVSGFLTGMTDTYTTGFTYSNNTLTLKRNASQPDLSVLISTMTGLTVTGGISATTISATTFYGNGSNLTGLVTQDTTVTGGTYSSGNILFTNNTGGTFTVTGLSTGYTLTSSAINTALGYTPLSAYTDTFVTGGTYSNGTTTFTNNTGGTFTVSGLYTGYTAPVDVTVTGGTYSNGTASFTNNTGGTFTVSGFKTSDLVVTGGTYNNSTGVTTFTNNTGGTFNVNGYYTGYTLTSSEINSALGYTPLSAYTDTIVTGGTYSNGTTTFTNNTGGTFNVTGYYTGYTAPIDIRVTGGTYSSGTATFTNNTGGTFSVSGFKTDDIYTTGMTFNTSNYNLSITRNDGTSFTQSLAVLASDMTITGGTYNANSGVATFTNNTGGTFSVSGFLTGMTDTYTTGLTFSNNVLTLKQTNNQADLDILINNLSGLTVNGSLSATTFYGNGSNLTGLVTQDTVVTGGTYNSGSILFTNNTGGTFNVSGLYTGYTAPVDVFTTGATYSNNTFTHTNNTGGTYSVLFNTVTGLTVNGNLNVTGLTTTNGITSTSGVIFPQKNLNSSYTATTDDYFLNITGGTFDITLMSAVSVKGKLLVVKNEGYGIVNVLPQIGETIDDRADVLLTKGNSLQLVSDGDNWVILGYNISSTQANTGVISFTGLSKVSSSTFYVAPVKGFIVDDTTNPVIPFLTYVEYSGGTHTATYVNSSTESWVYLTSGGTISQTNIPLTDQERRQNIFLGKLGHADKTSIINAFSQPDFILSPLAQLRDMFSPINLINEGIRPSANGANLSFNTSAGYLHGLGINFANDTLNPNSIYVSGTAPCTFQYRTQTGGTASNVTVIDPTKYDVGGVVNGLSGTKATNQRIYLVQNGVFRVQYGQTEYSTLAQAIAGLSSEPFVEFSNFATNGILVGVLSVLSSATDLSDTNKAQFFNVSKFGDSSGAAGGAATTTLQQAYNNSTNPEIIINATLDGLTIKNGTGNADNVTRLLEGQTGTNGITSFIRADGYISGTTFQSNGFNANNDGVTATTVSATTLITPSFRANNGGITATTVSATTYYNLPNVTLQQAYTASTSPEFTINSTQLGVQFRNDTGDDNTPMMVIQNNAGFDKGEWRADGTMYVAGLYSAGDVVITGNTNISGTTSVVGDIRGFSLVSTQSINDEGGEVRLATPQTNTSLSGGNITFDVYQNKLRFFESGGSNRGVYIDLTAAATGVGTNLLSGGGGEINTASNLGSGTGLFAQKVAADLQFKSLTSTGGTVTFTNTSNTINLEVVSASNFTGGTVNGATNFTNGLTANTFSATTYFNLPTDITVTGGTYNNGSISFTNNTGGTFSVNTSTNYSAGVISGATGWTSTGTGQINLPAVKVALYNNAFNIEPIIVYDVATGTSGTGGIPSLTDNDTNYVVIEYNNGTPIYNVYDNDSMVNDSSVVLFMIVYRVGNFIHTLEFGNQGAGLANKLNDRFIMTDRFGYESGLSLGLSASTEVITLSAGVAWNGPNRQSLNSLNSQDDVFFKNYHSGGNWTYTTTGNTINNTHYDNGTDIVLATGGKYLVNWYFRGQEINDHLYEVYSTSEYDSIALAQLSTEPSLPELITSHAILLGRIIIGVGASTGLTESAFVNVFQSTNVTSHNDLTALQGGSAGQYYHLNSNQFNNLALTNTNNNFSVLQSFNNGLSATTITSDTSIITTVSATTVTANNFIGDGSQITNIPSTIPYGLISAISSGNYLV